MDNTDNYQAWKKKRKATIIAFTIQNILLGLEYSLTFLTLWSYVGQIHASYPRLCYGLIAVSYLAVAAVFSTTICKYADRSRNVRLIFFVINGAVIAGNFIYSLSFSPWILLIGRIIAGFGIPLRSVMTGEMSRCYEHGELTSKFSLLGMAYGFGFVAGPGINFVFGNMDSMIGKWRITFANVPGIYVAILFSFAQVMCYFMIHNLSKEYDMKSNNQKEVKTKNHYLKKCHSYASTIDLLHDILSEIDAKHGIDHEFIFVDLTPNLSTNDDVSENTPLIPNNNDVPSTFKVTKVLMSHYDTALLLVLAFFENFFVNSFNMWIPMAVVTYLQWPIDALNAIVLGTGIFSILPCILLIFKKFSDTNIFWFATVCVGLMTCFPAVHVVLTFYKTNLGLNIFLWVVYSICFSNVMIIKDIFLAGFLAKMVTSRVQAVADSIRLSVARFGAIKALLLAPLYFQYMKFVGFIYIMIAIVLVVLMIVRRNTLANPKIIINL